MQQSTTRYAVAYWRGQSAKWRSYANLELAREFCDKELAQHRGVLLLAYDAKQREHVRMKMLEGL